ncbi:hypothetical protein E3C22_16530 [Jiella endophytica]|uniref:Uncharacterized protein n=1 Tax=Jiella endophytica TaxID=2558362 RepID=A0A4Y8RE00_9HYPH|nr:hypothetical protein [Jiella endophytica]TFF20515.1 hypothetical protein E3C22_16530 [Jiella endophytica]
MSELRSSQRLSARIRQLRRFFSEYDRSGLAMNGTAVDALAERLRSFEIDAADLEIGARPAKIMARSMPEIARRYASSEAGAAR